MSKKEVELKNCFTWYEKLSMRGGLVALVGIGAFAIYRSDPLVVAGYLLFVVLGGLVVMYDSLCVYCPYPFNHLDCLFFPYQLVASVTMVRTKPIPCFRNALSALVLVGIVAIVHHVIYEELCLGRVQPASRQKYIRIMEDLVSRGAQAIVLGCTEIGLLVGSHDCRIPIFDTARIHAEAAVALALEKISSSTPVGMCFSKVC